MSKKLKHRPREADLEPTKQKATDLALDGKVEQAIEVLSQALLNHPKRTDLVLHLAKILIKADRMDEAAETLIVLKAHWPENAEIAKLLGAVYVRMRKYNQAEAEFEASLKLDPKDPSAYTVLSTLYEQTGRDEQAANAIRTAVSLQPFDKYMLCHAAGVLHHTGRDREARDLLLSAPASVASSAEVRFLEAMQMPIIPSGTTEIAERRAHFHATLRDLRDSGARMKEPEQTLQVTNFNLGYHGLEDRQLIEETAQTLLSAAPHLGYVADLERPAIAGRRLKVGFVSSNMRVHSVGRVLNRFLKELNRERFEVVLFELHGKFEGGQETARAHADRTVFVPKGLKESRAAIEAERMDLLVFPDFVLEPDHDYLAYSRLAPVQCSTWGHPGTSGRPSMDYWISCEDWEPPGNERLYTERLIRFTKPPMIATQVDVPEALASRSDLGLPDGRLYGCPQSLYKLHPEFDAYMGEVLRADPEGHVLLIGGIQPRWIETFRKRFEREYADVAERLVILPHLSLNRYLGVLSHCEVSLDPIHFGGANTSMEAFTMGLPVITQPGNQLRNRQTLSFYRMMDFEDLVVDTREKYVQLATSLARDRPYRDELSKLLQERCHVLFDTIDVTRQLESFFEESCRSAIA